VPSPNRVAPDPQGFFESVHDAFETAEQAVGGAITQDYALAGYTMRLRLAGPALIAALTPALEHLATPPAPRADLTLCLWDSASTQTVMPLRPWQTDDLIVRGDVQGYNNARFHTMLSGDVGTVSVLDTTENLGVFWIRAASQLPMYERGAPLRVLIHWWMRQHGRSLIHTGAVGHAGNGLLLIGKAGSGKSSTTLLALLNGWSYVGDDYCLLANGDTPYIHSVYNSAKVNPSHLRNFPTLLPAISNPHELDSEKALLYLYRHLPTGMVPALPIKMILLPRVTGRPETTVTPVSRTAALRALAPSSLFQLPGTGQAEFMQMTQLVSRVPCYSLELGTDLDRIPETMLKVLNQ
jgi:hypothetical protein